MVVITALELKKYVYENNLIEKILESVGCHHITYHPDKEYFSCCNPDGDNPGAINIRNNEYLNYRNFTRGVSYDDNKDIFNLVQDIKSLSFIDAIKYIHELLGMKYSFKKQKEQPIQKIDPLDIFKRVKSKYKIKNVADFKIYDENTLDEYVPLTHISWYKDGIMPWTSKKFGLCYSYRNKRQCIPIRYWLDGSLMGLNQRTTVENYEEFGIRKYYLSEGLNKSINLYGLWEHRTDIEQLGYCVIYEAERSVLKRDSLGDNSGVALQGHSLSDEQIRILLGLNIKEIVIAMDKDIQLEEIYSMCEHFYHIRKVSFIQDRWDLLGQKDSPADAKNKIFQFLYKYRTVYDEKLHQEYIRSLKHK